MAGELTLQNRHLATENALHSVSAGRGVDPAALLYQTSGTYNGEKIAPIPQVNALGLTESVENLAESGALSLLRNRSNASQTTGSGRSKPVMGRSSASELRDTTSSSADADEPDAIVKRISSLLDAFDGGTDMGGGGGGGGGSSGDTGQHQHQRQQEQAQAHLQGIGSIGSSSIRQSAAFMDRMNAIRDRAIDLVAAQPNANLELLIETLKVDIRSALGELSFDFVQQLMALDASRSHFGAGDIFSEALDSLQREFDRFDIGGHLNQAVSGTLAAIKTKIASRATMETDPAATRETQRRNLRESEGKLDEVITKLEDAHPTLPLRSVIANYIAASGLEMSGIDGAGIDKEHLHNLLREIAALKMLNSVYDQILDLLDKTKLKESEIFRATDVVRGTLKFVAQPKPTMEEGIGNILSLIPRDRLDLDSRLLFSTNFDDMHCNLPDGVFPGHSPNDQSDARMVQQKVIKSWRNQLAMEEVMLDNPVLAARQKQAVSSLFGGSSGVTQAA